MQFVDTPTKKRRVRTEKVLQKKLHRSSSFVLFVKYLLIPTVVLSLWLFVRIDVHFNDTHEVGQRLYALVAMLGS